MSSGPCGQGAAGFEPRELNGGVVPCRACESAALVADAPPEIRDGIASAMWVAAFLEGVGAGSRGAASVEAARVALCEPHRKVGDIICETIAVLVGSKAETLPAPPEAEGEGGDTHARIDAEGRTTP